MNTLVFVTGNPYKFEIARKALNSVGVEVVQQKMETPEIQSAEVTEVAAYSARWAAEKLGKPVVVTDAGYYILALNGFPGPFIKYINNWLTAEDLLALMERKTDRKAEIRICMAYCQPNQEPVTFLTTVIGSIAVKPGKKLYNDFPIGQIFIPEGFNKVISEIPKEENDKYWMDKENYWKELAEYLKSKDKYL